MAQLVKKGHPDIAETELRNRLSWAVCHVTNCNPVLGGKVSRVLNGCDKSAQPTQGLQGNCMFGKGCCVYVT